MSTYEPFGPFKLKTRQRAVEDSDRRAFWDDVEAKHPGLADAVGCYIFATRTGGGVKPWYVGKAERTPFKQEVWNHKNLNTYNRVLRRLDRASPILYLLARETAGGRFRKKTQSRISDLRFVEEMLIGVCLARNPELENKSQTKHLRSVCIPGYMNSNNHGRPPAAVSELSKLLKG